MAQQKDTARLAILLAVRNGAAFLPAQLQSYADQSFVNWDLRVGDDGSTDESPQILAEFGDRMRPLGHDVTVCPGPQTGSSTGNFLMLLAQGAPAEWTAFSDQDDVWLPDKLARATTALAAYDPEVPVLYCSRTWVTDVDLQNPVVSRPFARPPDFRNALVQNIAAGNTIVLNRAAGRVAQQAVQAALAVQALPVHDWWLYQLITGVGGQVHHDPEPTLYYRQHGGNQIGVNRGLRAALVRVKMLLDGQYKDWRLANVAALRAAEAALTPENRARLEDFAALDDIPPVARLRRLSELGLYRQTSLAQMVMWCAIALGRS